MGGSDGQRIVTRAELESKNGKDGSNAWVLIGSTVYDVTRFKAMHPGGEKVLATRAGTDATDAFWALHRQEVLEKWSKRLAVGVIEDAESSSEDIASLDTISSIPYAEHVAWQGFESPYINESHIGFRERLRGWVHQNLRLSNIGERHEASGERVPDDLFATFGKLGIHAARLGPGAHMNVWKDQIAEGDKTIFGVTVEEFDYHHEAIVHEELTRVGCPGFYSGCGDGMVIGLPPVNNFGPQWMKEKVVPDVLSGKKRICLAISEPAAGSDVANITTTAKLTPDGKHYVVNGTKKWITQGHHADYFTCAVRTGSSDDGMQGISLLLLERGMPGLETKPIKTSYSSCAGTALVILEDVLVPVENLIGEENAGFMCIMTNFNHERWYIVVYILAAARSIVEECFKWIMQRRAFNKRLADQGVVRFKMAQMIGALEPLLHWLDFVTHQMNNLDYNMQSMRLAGTTSLLKFQSTRAASLIADNATNLLGGRGITRQGMGRNIERFNVGYKFAAILGGSEEIMADLGIKMAMRSFPANARL